MKANFVTRSFILAFFAVLGLTVGAYLMPQINPYFASRPQITCNEARDIAEEFLKKQNYDVSDYFSDAKFTYDVTGLDYLMSKFGVKSVIAMSRAEQLPL